VQSSNLISRRRLVSSAGAIVALLLTGCAKARPRQTGTANGAGAAPLRRASMTVHRDPGCGCCEAWANLARGAGYQVSLVDEADMPSIKRRLGVPPNLASCHTAVVDNLVFEGHVPFELVGRVLRTRPTGIRGLAVPGMPAGSPGMEGPGGNRIRVEVFAFDASGRSSVFSQAA
jgi:hypothetical protein